MEWNGMEWNGMDLIRIKSMISARMFGKWIRTLLQQASSRSAKQVLERDTIDVHPQENNYEKLKKTPPSDHHHQGI
jgi:hypothetical protein